MVLGIPALLRLSTSASERSFTVKISIEQTASANLSLPMLPRKARNSTGIVLPVEEVLLLSAAHLSDDLSATKLLAFFTSNRAMVLGTPTLASSSTPARANPSTVVMPAEVSGSANFSRPIPSKKSRRLSASVFGAFAPRRLARPLAASPPAPVGTSGVLSTAAAFLTSSRAIVLGIPPLCNSSTSARANPSTVATPAEARGTANFSRPIPSKNAPRAGALMEGILPPSPAAAAAAAFFARTRAMA
mmetsp:Transcript_36323/g.108969  ORF Transcript_36323/g.108969 Transcript_36323/m.108969 type:complete len:246 (+) Transcript_36323:3153-3890(+)